MADPTTVFTGDSLDPLDRGRQILSDAQAQAAAAGGGPQVVEAGLNVLGPAPSPRAGAGVGGPRVTQTLKQQYGAPIPDQIAGPLDERARQANLAYESALGDVAGIEAERHFAASEVMRRREQLLANEAEKQEYLARQRQQWLGKVVQDYHKTSNELSKAEVDPKRLFKTNAWSTITASISVLLGSLAQSLRAANGQNTQNNAMVVLNQAIDRDIRAQQANIDAKKTRLGGIQNTYSQMLQLFGTEDAAQAATKALMLERSQAQLNRIAAQSDSQAVLARAGLANAELEKMRTAALQQAAQSAAGYVDRQVTQKSGGGGGGNSFDKWLSRATKVADLGNKIQQLSAKSGAQPMTAKEAGGLAEQLTSYQAVNRLLDQAQRMKEDLYPTSEGKGGLKGMYTTGGNLAMGRLPLTDARNKQNQLKQLQSQLALTYSKMYLKGQGQVSDHERQMINQILPALMDPTSSAKPLLDQLRNQARMQVEETWKSSGLDSPFSAPPKRR